MGREAKRNRGRVGNDHVDHRGTHTIPEGELRLSLRLSEDDIERIARRTAELLERTRADDERGASPYLSVPEAASYLRCKRQRLDDLLSQGVLTRVKDGARTLIARAELEAYLRAAPTGRVAGRRVA